MASFSANNLICNYKNRDLNPNGYAHGKSSLKIIFEGQQITKKMFGVNYYISKKKKA